MKGYKKSKPYCRKINKGLNRTSATLYHMVASFVKSRCFLCIQSFFYNIYFVNIKNYNGVMVTRRTMCIVISIVYTVHVHRVYRHLTPPIVSLLYVLFTWISTIRTCTYVHYRWYWWRYSCILSTSNKLKQAIPFVFHTSDNRVVYCLFIKIADLQLTFWVRILLVIYETSRFLVKGFEYISLSFHITGRNLTVVGYYIFVSTCLKKGIARACFNFAEKAQQIKGPLNKIKRSLLT